MKEAYRVGGKEQACERYKEEGGVGREHPRLQRRSVESCSSAGSPKAKTAYQSCELLLYTPAATEQSSLS